MQRSNILPVLVLAIISALVSGCGGGGGSSAPATSEFLGAYSGTYTVTAGANTGKSSAFVFSVDANGGLNGQVTSVAGAPPPVAAVTGSVLRTGNFSATGSLPGGNSVAVGGLISQTNVNPNKSATYTGSGTISFGDGNSGTVSFSRV